jgi:hypothetical protein
MPHKSNPIKVPIPADPRIPIRDNWWSLVEWSWRTDRDEGIQLLDCVLTRLKLPGGLGIKETRESPRSRHNDTGQLWSDVLAAGTGIKK